MAPPRYPQSCTSAYCGRVLCDGCREQPALVAFYTSRGPAALQRYEQRQDELRQQKATHTGIFSPPYEHTS